VTVKGLLGTDEFAARRSALGTGRAPNFEIGTGILAWSPTQT